jgi:hypothetical protein
MPRIQQYVSPEAQRGIDPSPLASAAHRIGIMGHENADSIRSGLEQFGEGVEQAGETYGAMHDVPALAEDRIDREAKSVRFTNNFFNGGTDGNGNQVPGADPHDPQLLDKYRAGIEKIWDDFGETTNTRIGARTAAAWKDESTSKYTNIGVADASSAAAGAVHSGILNFANKASDISYADPTQHKAMQKQLADYVDAQVSSMPWMSPSEAATVRSEYIREGQQRIAQGAARGIAEKGGASAMRSVISSGEFDGLLDGQQQSEAQHYADEQSRASITAQKAQAEEVRRQNHEDFEAKSSSLTASFIQPDGSLAVPPNAPQMIAQLSLHPGATAGEVRSLTDMAARVLKEQQEGKKAITDPHTYDDFKSRLTLGADDPRALTDEQVISARANGQLSDKDYGFFKGAISTLAHDPGYRVAQQQFKSFMRGIRSSITNSNVLMGKNDPAGDQKYLQFEQQATTEFESAYKTGKWHDLLSRDAKNSLWHQAVPYMTGQKESLDNLTNRAQGNIGLVPSVNAPKRNAGESAADYLKRTGGP